MIDMGSVAIELFTPDASWAINLFGHEVIAT
jgi:hypothetical protein